MIRKQKGKIEAKKFTRGEKKGGVGRVGKEDIHKLVVFVFLVAVMCTKEID